MQPTYDLYIKINKTNITKYYLSTKKKYSLDFRFYKNQCLYMRIGRKTECYKAESYTSKVHHKKIKGTENRMVEGSNGRIPKGRINKWSKIHFSYIYHDVIPNTINFYIPF